VVTGKRVERFRLKRKRTDIYFSNVQ